MRKKKHRRSVIRGQGDRETTEIVWACYEETEIGSYREERLKKLTLKEEKEDRKRGDWKR